MANAWDRTVRFLGVRDPDPRVDDELRRRIDELEARVGALEQARGADDREGS